jgi:hypothetical protein
MTDTAVFTQQPSWSNGLRQGNRMLAESANCSDGRILVPSTSLKRILGCHFSEGRSARVSGA